MESICAARRIVKMEGGRRGSMILPRSPHGAAQSLLGARKGPMVRPTHIWVPSRHKRLGWKQHPTPPIVFFPPTPPLPSGVTPASGPTPPVEKGRHLNGSWKD